MSYLRNEDLGVFSSKEISGKCASCRWWRPNENPAWVKTGGFGDTPVDDKGAVKFIGECRRNAPRLALADIESEKNVRGGGIDNPMAAVWPETDWADDCGDYTYAHDEMPIHFWNQGMEDLLAAAEERKEL